VTDPYDILGVERDADEAQLKAAYRRLAKVAHPDSGGDSEAFANLQKAYGLLLDPVRRKVYDDTGYDVEFADAAELQALVMIEKLVTDAVLDERAPGSFDPVAVMQDSLSEELRKARFSKSELERHASRIGLHLERLEKQSGRDGTRRRHAQRLCLRHRSAAAAGCRGHQHRMARDRQKPLHRLTADAATDLNRTASDTSPVPGLQASNR
jgi:curved DNA-binding protein CbpA